MKRFIWISLMVLAFAMVFAVLPAMAQGAEPPIVIGTVTASSVAVILTSLLTLLADYFPGFAAWFDALSVASKRQFMLVGAVLIVAVIFAGKCFAFFETDLVCSVTGAWDVLFNVLLAFAVAQGLHAGTKPTPAFKADVLKIPAKSNKK
jgi:hypothetical protein